MMQNLLLLLLTLVSVVSWTSVNHAGGSKGHAVVAFVSPTLQPLSHRVPSPLSSQTSTVYNAHRHHISSSSLYPRRRTISFTSQSSQSYISSRVDLSASSDANHLPTQTSVYQVAQSSLPSVALVLPVGVRNITARGSGFVVDFPLNSESSTTDNTQDFDDGRMSVDSTKQVFAHEDATTLVYLLTAAHVAAPGYRIEVVFSSPDAEGIGEEGSFSGTTSIPASVVGRNDKSDLALLRVDLSDYIMNTAFFSSTTDAFDPPPPLKLSNKRAKVGTQAYSIGYPSGGVVGAAMTSGIVCGNARGLVTGRVAVGDTGKNETGGTTNDTTSIDERTRYIVTDAAMAGGMSGGPLVDSNGVVLGVNALINMELRALGNYAVDASECLEFLLRMSKRLGGSNDKQSDGSSVTACTYRIVLYNDRFNKRERVEGVLKEVASLNITEANKIMMEAHTLGRGVVREISDEEDAKSLCEELRREDLLVELEVVTISIDEVE